jgi:hypothetical protein
VPYTLYYLFCAVLGPVMGVAAALAERRCRAVGRPRLARLCLPVLLALDVAVCMAVWLCFVAGD